jgi:hypothetical protein
MNYLRLVGEDEEQHWDSRGRFFAAAAEAMRRILVGNARRKGSQKRGGARARADFEVGELAAPELREDLLALALPLHYRPPLSERRLPMASRSWIRRLFARTPSRVADGSRKEPARFRPRRLPAGALDPESSRVASVSTGTRTAAQHSSQLTGL